MITEIVILIISTIGIIYFLNKKRKATQLKYIQTFKFNAAIGQKVKQHYPHLTDDNVELVIKGLREYFLICHETKRKMVSMPSQVVDIAWHEFILFTRQYQIFCRKGLGRFLHHTPAEAMTSAKKAQTGIKRAWRISCAQNKINPNYPKKLPLIFAIDSILKIENGFTYTLNCQSLGKNDFCTAHIGCASGCAGHSGRDLNLGAIFSDHNSDTSGCSNGCGGGD